MASTSTSTTPTAQMRHRTTYHRFYLLCLCLFLSCFGCNPVDCFYVSNGTGTFAVPSRPLDYGFNMLAPGKSVSGRVVYVGGACNTEVLQDLTGSIALVDRGSCFFYQKVMNTQSKGAVGMILINNAQGNTVGTDSPLYERRPVFGNKIHACVISLKDGAAIKAQQNAMATLYGSEWIENPGNCDNEKTCSGRGYCAYSTCICDYRYYTELDNCIYDWTAYNIFLCVVSFLAAIYMIYDLIRLFRAQLFNRPVEKTMLAVGFIGSIINGVFYAGNTAYRNSLIETIEGSSFILLQNLGFAAYMTAVGFIILICFRSSVTKNPRALLIARLFTVGYIIVLVLEGCLLAAYRLVSSVQNVKNVVSVISFAYRCLFILFALFCGISGVYMVLKSKEDIQKTRALIKSTVLTILSITSIGLSLVFTTKDTFSGYFQVNINVSQFTYILTPDMANMVILILIVCSTIMSSTRRRRNTEMEMGK